MRDQVLVREFPPQEATPLSSERQAAIEIRIRAAVDDLRAARDSLRGRIEARVVEELDTAAQAICLFLGDSFKDDAWDSLPSYSLSITQTDVDAALRAVRRAGALLRIARDELIGRNDPTRLTNLGKLAINISRLITDLIDSCHDAQMRQWLASRRNSV